MRRTAFEKFHWVCLTLFLCLICLSSATLNGQTRPATASAPTTAAAGQPTSAPTTTPATALAAEADLEAAKAEAFRGRNEGIEQALAGRFEAALEQLRRADALAADPATSVAIKLLEEYVSCHRQAESGRAAEYAEAVQRVHRSMLALEYLPELAAAEIEKTLRDKVLEVASDYEQVGRSDSLELASPEEAAKLKAEAGAFLAAARDNLNEARKLLAEDTSEYAAAFGSVAESLCEHLSEYEVAWAEVTTDTTKARLDAADRLRKLEEEMARAMGDLETMIVAKPWKVGLMQANLAKELAADKSKVAEEDWYQNIKAITEEQGEKAVADARWYDALRAYGGLSRLEPDSNQYRQQVRTIRRHVRVLSLYGKEDRSHKALAALEPESIGFPPDIQTQPVETQPTRTKVREDRTTWREAVSAVDAVTVRNTISEIDRYYVTAVDYRKVGLGALKGIRVLAETPQAAESFTGLDREDLREKFLKAVRSASVLIEKDDRLDHIDILTAFNSVLRASQRTVDIPVEVLAVEFAEGMLDELDEFSSMVWPYDLPNFQKHMTGRFFGVGIQITKERGEPLKVITPLAESPAYKAGIKTGDVILAVDGKRTEALSVEKLVHLITGEKGTRVVLTIKRPGMLKAKDFAIIRDEIRIQTVKGWRRRLPNGDWDHVLDPNTKIGYIRVTQFTNQTTADVVEVLEEMRDMHLRSLVLDMRFNPGGLLRAATSVADEFLPTGRLVSTKGRSTPPAEINAHPKGRYLDGDLVVLVNGYSASAAEIVSGAIKDWRRGLIVGERTFGKGSVQNVIPIPHKQAVLKLTTAYYYLPSGRLLHRKNNSKIWGVDPDVEVGQTPKQMRRWLGIRRKTDLIQDIAPEELNAELSRQFDADLPLNTAVLLLKLMRLRQSKPAA